MRHISLDESFWRSATKALVSGELLHEIEPSLLDLSQLLLHLQDSAKLRPGGRLGLLTLGGSEEERALGLTLAALLARHGSRVLLVDLDFSDDTWARLLGAEELEGLASHLAYGTRPERLVRSSTWESLALLPTGSGAVEPAGLLRSDKLAACIASLSPSYDLLCVGLPFVESLQRGMGAMAVMERAILIGPARDELGFDLAIPTLLEQVELLTTLDVPPLGRWRPGLGAALPALSPNAAGSWLPAQASWTSSPHAAAGSSPHDSSAAAADLPPFLVHPPLRDSTAESPSVQAPTAGSGSLRDLGAEGPPTQEPAAGPRPLQDPEAEADMAFLSALLSEGTDSDLGIEEGSSRERNPGDSTHARRLTEADLLHPRLRQSVQHHLDFPAPRHAPDLQEPAYGSPPEEEAIGAAGAIAAPPMDPGNRWRATALVVFLSVVLGAGAFWYWRFSQRVPEGQFTLVESPAVQPAPAELARPSPVPASGAATEESNPPALAGASTDGAPRDADRDLTAEADAATAEPARGDEVEFAPPSSGPVLGFSVHVGSFKSYRASGRVAASLRARGRTAFIAPVLLQDKGRWHRVFMGALDDAQEAEASLTRAIHEGLVREGKVRETPWALYLGTFQTLEAAEPAVAKLRRSGILAYAVGAGPVHLYAGAFEAAADAELLNRELRNRGIEAALARRREPEAPGAGATSGGVSR